MITEAGASTPKMQSHCVCLHDLVSAAAVSAAAEAHEPLTYVAQRAAAQHGMWSCAAALHAHIALYTAACWAEGPPCMRIVHGALRPARAEGLSANADRHQGGRAQPAGAL